MGVAVAVEDGPNPARFSGSPPQLRPPPDDSLDADADRAPVLAFATGGGVRIDFDLTTVLAQMVLFCTLMLVLKPLLFDPVMRVLEERERRTDGTRAEARRLQEEAGELLQEYEQALDRVREVASQERDRLRTETSQLEGEILATAHANAARVVAEGRQRIQQELTWLQSELERESERIASHMAASVLGREVDR